MPCDVATQRRRKKWEYDDRWNAACLQEMGFANGFGLSSQFLLRNATAQTDPKWSWLDGEKIMKYEDAFFNQDKGFYWLSEDQIHQVFLHFTGVNEVLEPEPGVFVTAQARLEIMNFSLFPDIKIDVEAGTLQSFKPFASNPWGIVIDDELAPNPIGTPSAVGTFENWPLKKCHDCVDEP